MKKLLLMALALFAFVSVNAQRLDVPLRNRELMDNLQNPTSYYDVDRNYAYYGKMIYNISRRSLTPLGPLGWN